VLECSGPRTQVRLPSEGDGRPGLGSEAVCDL